jgi:hypothetical protein
MKRLGNWCYGFARASRAIGPNRGLGFEPTNQIDSTTKRNAILGDAITAWVNSNEDAHEIIPETYEQLNEA